jgi:hypothetical protein
MINRSVALQPGNPGRVKTKADELRQYAEEALRWAEQSTTEKERLALPAKLSHASKKNPAEAGSAVVVALWLFRAWRRLSSRLFRSGCWHPCSGSRSCGYGRRIGCCGCRFMTYHPDAESKQGGYDDGASDPRSIAGLRDVPRRIGARWAAKRIISHWVLPLKVLVWNDNAVRQCVVPEATWIRSQCGPHCWRSGAKRATDRAIFSEMSRSQRLAGSHAHMQRSGIQWKRSLASSPGIGNGKAPTSSEFLGARLPNVRHDHPITIFAPGP